MRRLAFTMIEMVFVIVVLGIIAAVAIPSMDQDRSQEGTDAVISYIRMTQQIALSDDVQWWNDSNWQRKFWRIEIESCGSGSGLFLSMGKDSDEDGSLDKNETLSDPYDGKPLFWKNTDDCSNGGDGTVSENTFLTKKYHIASVNFTSGCDGKKHIGFDYLGRPHTGFEGSITPDFSSYMPSDCDITLTFENGKRTKIRIEPQTGYVHQVGSNEP